MTGDVDGDPTVTWLPELHPEGTRAVGGLAFDGGMTPLPSARKPGPDWVETLQGVLDVARLFNLPAPAIISMHAGLPIGLQFTGDLTVVDDWAVALLPSSTPELREQILGTTPDRWRKYVAVGERHGHVFEVWTSKRVPGDAP